MSMKLLKKSSLILVLSLLAFSCSAGLRSVLVEKYYISDSLDRTDTIGGMIEPGSVTYRIFVSLDQGDFLKKIYGDASHPLMISSTRKFFNNRSEGQTFGKDIIVRRLNENTVALDSWITLGQCTKSSGVTLQGIPKISDTDGSFVGGAFNDGGSATVPGGLLQSQNPLAGEPIFLKDGYDTMQIVPANWAHFGFLTQAGVDSSIFGILSQDTLFYTRAASLQNNGTYGTGDDNWILVLQLTTAGTLSFELNLEVSDSNGVIKKFVAGGDTLLNDEVLFPDLKYPPICGCTDPNFLEYSESFSCSNLDSCITPIVFGCMDPAACNYNPLANFSLPEICCYPGFCNDLDLSIACPTLSIVEAPVDYFKIYPNPFSQKLSLVSPVFMDYLNIEISNVAGQIIYSKDYNKLDPVLDLDLGFLREGFYTLMLHSGGQTFRYSVIKAVGNE